MPGWPAGARKDRKNGDLQGPSAGARHGPPVYAYPVEYYAFWERELGREAFPHGQFGENLAASGMSEDTVRVGDICRMTPLRPRPASHAVGGLA